MSTKRESKPPAHPAEGYEIPAGVAPPPITNDGTIPTAIADKLRDAQAAPPLVGPALAVAALDADAIRKVVEGPEFKAAMKDACAPTAGAGHRPDARESARAIVTRWIHETFHNRGLDPDEINRLHRAADRLVEQLASEE